MGAGGSAPKSAASAIPVTRVPLLACSGGQAAGQLGAEVVGVDDGVHDQVGGQADQVDVLAVLALEPLHLGRPLGLGEGGQLVVVDGVDGRLRPHHRDRRGGQGQGGVGLEPGPGHGVQPGPVRLADDHADLGHGGLADGGDQLGPVADDALALDLGPDHEPGHVGQEHQRQVEGVAQPDEAGHLVGRVDEQHPALDHRLVGDDADGPALDPAQAADHLGGELALDLEEALLVDHGRDQRVDVERLRLVGRDQGGHRPGVGRPPRGLGRRVAPPVPGEVAEVAAGGLDGLVLVGAEQVAAARHPAVHGRPAHLLQGRLLADHHLGHAGRAQVHGGVALDHEHDVAEGRDVGPAGRRRAEQAADLGHPAGQPHLVVEDLPGPAPAREHLHLVGDPGPGRVDQPQHRHLVAQRVLLDAEDLLHRPGAPRPRLDGRVVGHHRHRAPADGADPGDHPVGRQVAGQGVGQQPVLDEPVGRVEQPGQPLPHEQLALLAGLGVVALGPAGPGLLGQRPQRRLGPLRRWFGHPPILPGSTGRPAPLHVLSLVGLEHERGGARRGPAAGREGSGRGPPAPEGGAHTSGASAGGPGEPPAGAEKRRAHRPARRSAGPAARRHRGRPPAPPGRCASPAESERPVARTAGVGAGPRRRTRGQAR